MLAICNDIDRATPQKFDALHRFLNTREPTPMGEGLGLDIADSMWFYAPEGRRPDAATWQMSFFDGLEPGRRTPFADKILSYMRCGWIDTLHTYGNFSSAPVFERRHAEEAFAVLRDAGAAPSVWVNHGNSKNRQNIGAAEYMEGDVRGAAAYHADLLVRNGVRFLWSGRTSGDFVRDPVIRAQALADGGKVWLFERQDFAFAPDAEALAARYGAVARTNQANPFLMLWHPQVMHLQLSEANLDELVARQGFAILAQHFGSGEPLRRFGLPAVEALRRLKDRQDAGEVLVARTARLLGYVAMRDHVVYETSRDGDTVVVDILGIDDPVRGKMAPLIDRLRGLTFVIEGARQARLLVKGKGVSARYLRRHDDAEANRCVLGIAWFEPDHTDYSVQEGPMTTISPSWHAEPQQGDGLGQRIADWLETQRDERPEHITPQQHTYAVEYSAKRYAVGIDHYRSVFQQLGMVGKVKGLDIGSGAGHWLVAFVQDNQKAVGIDVNENFVIVANRVAQQFGYADRVGSEVGKAEALPYPDSSFDAVWSHGVLMFCDNELSFSEISRVLNRGGSFYCGYSSVGFRLSGTYTGVLKGNKALMKSNLSGYLGGTWQKEGVAESPWARVRMLTIDELVRLCHVFGLGFVDQPGFQDGVHEFAGLPATIDLLCIKKATVDDHLAKLRETSAADAAGRAEFLGLVRIGLGRMVRRVMDERGEDLDDPEIRNLYVRALLQGGPDNDAVIDGLAAKGLDAKTRGLVEMNRRRPAPAVAAFEAMSEDDPDRGFLLGSARVFAQRVEAGVAELRRGIEAGHRVVDCRMAIIMGRLAEAEMPELTNEYGALLRDLPLTLGADRAKVEAVLGTLKLGS